MQIEIIKAVFRRAAFGGFSVAMLFLVLFSNSASAGTSNAQFYQYIFNICNSQVLPPSWNLVQVATMCMNAFPGGPQGGAPLSTVSSNLGVASAGGGLATKKKKGVQELTDEEKKKKSTQGASADGGGWGFLVTPQVGKSTRTETDLENGYNSTLKGLLVGVDYRFSDSLVMGATVAQTNDEATFFYDAGSLKTSNNILNVYGTWLPLENVSVDGYLGYGKINLDSRRFVTFGTLISGITSGNTSGRQQLAGLSVGYQKDYGRVSLAPFLNLDYIKTSFNGYDETGTTLLELHYGDRKVTSFTSSLGARLGSSYAYDWGMLLPSVRLAAVHEFQNNAQEINNELVSTPGTGMLVATDAPTRNYLIGGLGVVAALNGGTQVFLDFDKRARDSLLNTWALSLGVLTEF